MPQCCNSELYLSDKFCPHCGKTAAAPVPTKNAFEIDPSICSTYESKGSPFTGRVTDAQYYSRHSGDIASGYVWVTVETTKGKIEQLSLDGEYKSTQNIKPGDVISIHSPDGLTLRHAVSRDQKKTVSNNRAPHIAVLHRENNSNSAYVDDSISSPNDVSPSAVSCLMVATISGVIAWLMYSSWDFALSSPWLLAVCALVLICLYLARDTSKANKFLSKRARESALASDKMLNIYYHQLGFSNYQRPSPSAAVLCRHCDEAIAPDNHYCQHCGSAHSSASPEPEKETTPQFNNHEIAQPAPAEKSQFVSVNQNNQDLVKDYEVLEKTEYVHRYAFSANTTNEVYYKTKIVKVIDKHMGVSTDSGLNITEHITEYRNNFGTLIDTETRTTSKAYRKLNLNGYLSVKDKYGEETAFSSNANILSNSNIGDVLLIGESQLSSKDGQKYFLEYVYNLSSDRKHDYEASGLGYHYLSVPGSSIFTMVILGVAAMASFVMGPAVGLSALMLGGGYALINGLSSYFGNHSRKKSTIGILRKKLKACISNKDEIVKGFK